MKVEDDLKLHSHYIEDLFNSKDETFEIIENIKERVAEMKEKIGIHASEHTFQSENILKILENQKEISDKNQKLSELIDKINLDTYRRFVPIEFIREILGSPKSWILIIGLVWTIEMAIGMSDILKHFLRMS